MANTVLITGASRGIGRELAAQYAARGDAVIATRRGGGEPLKGVEFLTLEATDQGSIDALAGALKGRAIDVLINNAGVSSEAKSLEMLTAAELARCFAVNATAPMMVIKALMGNLRAGRRKAVVNISTQLASIANNTGGSSYPYRASKSALNQLTVSLANELRPEGFTCVAMHPGWVRTDMGGPRAPLSVEQAAGHIVGTIDRLGPEDSGLFVSYDGTPLPW
jgi:NAD(P)-dependent dehydrogenase (short-subunit alcohol dehydrogenase family)